jgi:ribosomal protein S12 methylthiotransferase
MNRPSDIEKIETLIHFARSMIPDLVIRTTMMVGFPGETEKEFGHLMEFVKRSKFDRLGIFTYSREKGTPAYHMHDQISTHVKQNRYNQIMELQADISKEKNQTLLGKTMDVICDYPDPNQKGAMIGRIKGQAPQIDGITFIKGDKLKQGKIYNVKIIKTDIYDLEGVKES